MTRLALALSLTAAAALGFSVAKIDDHVRRVDWGWVWTLRPEPDFHGVQLVTCPDGKQALPPWHVYVLYNFDTPVSRWGKMFLQERGR